MMRRWIPAAPGPAVARRLSALALSRDAESRLASFGKNDPSLIYSQRQAKTADKASFAKLRVIVESVPNLTLRN